MRITHLTNSGFAIEHNDALLLIDCFDPQHHPMLAFPAISAYSSITVLSSHRHPDHFNKRVLSLPASFVFSFDIKRYPNADYLEVGQTITVNGMEITAYGSTDEGVSFHILWDNTSIFHAGDLNNWHWLGEADETYASRAEEAFLNVLHTVKRGVDHIDLAMFPVDPRLGADYWRGAIQFISAMRPRVFVPMHYTLATGDIYAKTPAKELIDPRFFSQADPLTRIELSPPAFEL